MQFLIIVLLICFFLFLFVLHFLCRDDFILLRKDVSVEKVFNIAFGVVPFALFFSRLLHALSSPSTNFLNPLYFILFPYFPGLSLIGAILGTGLSLYLIFGSKKMPIERMLDLFSFSAVSVIPFGALGYFALNRNMFSLEALFFFVFYLLTAIFFYFFILSKFHKGRIKEGSASFLFLVFISIASILGEIIFGRINFKVENIVLAVVFASSLVLFIDREKIISKILRKK